MNPRRLWAVMRKDLLEVVGTGQVLLPMIIVPLVFVVILPAAMILGSQGLLGDPDIARMIEGLPPVIGEQLVDFDDRQTVVYILTVFVFASFFLIIPIMVSTIIAANSFAGEKERKTLEGLLYTPITDLELVGAKILSALIPALMISWICFLVYAVLVNVLAYPIFQGLFFPTVNWLVMMVLLVPAVACMAIALVVLISSKVRGYQEANSIAGALVLPIVLLTVGQVAGVIFFSTLIVVTVSAVFIVADFLLLNFIIRVFHRDRLVAYMK